MTLPSRLSPPLCVAKGYAYGVARDGVASVAFTVAGGGRVTVLSIGDITVRFADGDGRAGWVDANAS
jgi:hypothetical protein